MARHPSVNSCNSIVVVLSNISSDSAQASGVEPSEDIPLTEGSQLELLVKTPGLNHLLERIFGLLNVEDIIACSKLNRTWSTYLEIHRPVWTEAIERKLFTLRKGFPSIMKPSEVVAEFNAVFPKRRHLPTCKKRDVLTLMREGISGHYGNSTTICLRAQTMKIIGKMEPLKNPLLDFDEFINELQDVIENYERIGSTCEHRPKPCHELCHEV